MSAATISDGDSRDGKSTLPFYAAGCYAIPIRFLYGTAAEINFWDVVYYRAHETAGTFDTSTEELAEQMGLSRQVFGQLRREAIEHGALIEDDSWISGRRFVLRVSDFNRLTKGVVWKPVDYVRNGWHRVVTPAIPKRVLNFCLQRPRQSVYQLNVPYIAAKCRRHFSYDTCRLQEPLNSADVVKAMRLLVRLGLLMPAGNGFRINWAAFNRPAKSMAPSFDEPDLHEHPLFCQSATGAPVLAERALELVEIGHYDLDTHWADILRDLTYLHDDDFQLLKAKVYRHRNRPPGPHRWHDIWKAFQRELRRRRAEIRSPKSILNLRKATSASCVLALDIAQKQVRALRMVCRVEWPWHLEKATVELRLWSGDTLLLVREVGVGDAEVRHSLLPDQCSSQASQLILNAQCTQPLPGLHVEAWLEAQLQP